MSIGLNDFLIEAQIFLLFDKDRKNTEKNTELRRPLFKKLRTAIEAASVFFSSKIMRLCSSSKILQKYGWVFILN